MRIKQLTIHNIASIEDAFIDFDQEPLKDCDVFLISGKIGAGKSTILDAICLALYGTTPRINNGVRDRIDANEDALTGRDPRQLMRRNTGEAWARLTFEGTDGNDYEAEWHVQRGLRKKVSSALSADVWTLHNLTSGQVITGSTNKGAELREAVQQAVGLDFEQFCRTTMLAQGEFTKFLKSDESEKAAILEKITGTAVYSRIGEKIYLISREKRTIFETENAKLEGIRLLSEDEILVLRQQIRNLITIVEQKKTQRELSLKKKDWLTQRIQFEKDVSTAQTKYFTLRNESEQSEYQDSVKLLMDWETTSDLRQDQRVIEESEKEIQSLEKRLTELKQQYGQGKAGQSAMEKRLRQMTSDQVALKEKLEAQADKSVVFNESQTLLQLLRHLLALRKEQVTMETQLKQLDVEWRASRQRAQKMSDEFDQCQKKYAETTSEWSKDREQLERFRKSPEEWNPSVKAKGEEVRLAKSILESYEKLKQLSAQTVEQWAKQIRSTLAEGCRCPVCQQILQQPLPAEAELDQAYQEHCRNFEDQKKRVEDAQKAYEALCNELDTQLHQMVADKEKILKNIENRRDEALNAKTKAETERLTFENKISNVKEQLLKNQDRQVETEKEVSQGLDKGSWPFNWRTETTEFGIYLKQAAQAYQNDVKALETLQRTLDQEGKSLQAVKTLDARLLALMPDCQVFPDDSITTIPSLEAYWNALYANVSTVMGQLQSTKARQEKAKLRKIEFMSAHPEITETRLKELMSHEMTAMSHLKENVDAKRNTLLASKTAWETLSKQLEEHTSRRPEDLKDEDTVETLMGMISSLEQELGTLEQEKTLKNKVLEDDSHLRDEKLESQMKVERLREECAQWDRLRQYFGDAQGVQFRKIAQSFILGSLLDSANHYLKTLHPRYTLEVVSGTLYISLVDAYQGCAKRFVSTLSGGESFLVSLSLALALADIGQNLAVNTLFIDEGFGSLSGPELTNAINTLRDLHRASGRHVGIISHMDVVKESIPVQIQVLQEGNHSSSVVRVEVC